MRILGIDPGLELTGYGLIQAGGGRPLRLVEAGLIRTHRSEPLAQRLASVSQEFRALLSQHHPHVVAVEDLYSYYKTPKPAILMGHVRGVLLGTAALGRVPVVSYLPTQIKRAVVGRGHATKEQIARMVQMRLHLRERPSAGAPVAGPGVGVPADVTDALAVALCHAGRLKALKPPPRLWTMDYQRIAVGAST